MKSLQDIIELSENYVQAHNQQNERFATWNSTTKKVVADTLSEIVAYLTGSNDFFRSNLYFQNNETDIYVFSGKIRVDEGELENGFQIHFGLQLNGKLVVYTSSHSMGNNNPRVEHVEVIDEMSLVDQDMVYNLFYKALENVQRTSYLFQ